MISLPTALTPWKSQLSIFPAELGLAIGPLVQRIAAAIDPLHLEDLPGQGDPDGFDGLANRGSYERLIPSDWLLADEIPEEFERRATMCEHLFLKTAQKERAHGLGSTVLFDAGPDQLGSPRLAHLAILIALIRRARQARANFSWGILQEPREPLLQGSTEAEITELLRARTPENVSASEINDWIERCREVTKPEEIWLVGGSRLHELSPHHLVSRVKVEDILSPGVRRVAVEIHRAKGRQRKVVLDLPENSLCAWLLRDPFQVGFSAPRQLPTRQNASGLVFASGGRRIFSVLKDGTLLSLPIPNSPWDQPGKAKQHALGKIGRIVAANRFGRATAVVSLQEISLRVSYIGNETYPSPGHYVLRGKPFSWPHEDGGLLLSCTRPPVPSGDKSTLLVLDAGGELFRLKLAGQELVANVEESGVLALTTVAGIPTYLRFNQADHTFERTIEYTPEGRKPHRVVLKRDVERVERAFFGFGGDVQPQFCLSAVQIDTGKWFVFTGEKSVTEIRTESEQQIAGAIQEKSYGPALVSICEKGHLVKLTGSDWERTLFQSPDPIVHLTVSSSRPQLALVTTQGHITVYSLLHGKNLCSYMNESTND